MATIEFRNKKYYFRTVDTAEYILNFIVNEKLYPNETQYVLEELCTKWEYI